tara:strand:+ start:54870 stop:55217 length:348 start_codon:yes stop_codon:yes gene_type:complete
LAQRGLGIPRKPCNPLGGRTVGDSPCLLLTLALIHQAVESIRPGVLPSLASGLAVLGLVILLDSDHLIHEAALSICEDLDLPTLVAFTVGEVESDGGEVLLVVVTHGIKLSANVA